jgi:hypothetical protein
MASIYDKSSLVLIPSGTKTGKVYSQKPVSGDGDFTFTRSSAATRVNADGFIEKETQNLLTYSQDFSGSSWAATAIQRTYDQTIAPDGTNTADRLESLGSSAYVLQNESSVAGTIYTQSVYAKADSSNYLQMTFGTGGWGTSFVIFELTGAGSINKFFGTYVDAQIESVGNGWYRCSVTGQATSSSITAHSIVLPSFDNANRFESQVGLSIFVWGAQTEYGLVARDYIETTTTAVEGGITDNVPRLDYTDSSCPALLLEPQRTNLIPYSEYQSGSGFSLGANITWNGFVESPEGVNNASKFTSSTTSASFVQISNVTIPAGDFTFSMWVRGVSGSFVNRSMYIPSHTGTQATMNEAPVAGEDWKLVYGSGTNTSGSSYVRIITLPFYDQPANAVWEMYGFQLEAGSYPTSYIPTYGSSVTRTADNSVVTSASDLIGQTEGTMFFEGSVEHTPENVSIMNFNRSTQFSVAFLKATNDKINAFVYNGGSSIFNIVSTATSGKFKCAVAYKSGDTAFYVNGTQVGVNTTTFTPAAGLNEIYIGSYQSPYFAYDHPVECNQAMLFKTRLSNEELAALTTL